MKNIKNIKLNFFLFLVIDEYVLKFILLVFVDMGNSVIRLLLWEEVGEFMCLSGCYILY